MNENEIDRIANAINALRPDWPTASLRTLISKQLANRGRRDVAVALAWVACESATLTPARVLENGPWWKAVNMGGDVVRFPPRRDESCPRHPGEWPDNCRGCASDKLAGTESDAGNQRASVEPHDRVGVLRHLHQVAVSTLCSHGVAFEHCLQDHDTEGEAG